MNSDVMADAILAIVYKVLKRRDAPVAKVYSATWQSTTAGTDSLLSTIKLLDGSIINGCPYLDSTTRSSFHTGDPILVVKAPGVPYTILGRFAGDIRAATS